MVGNDKTRIIEMEAALTAAEFDAAGYQIEILALKAEVARLNAVNVALVTILVALLVWLVGTIAA